MKNLFTTLALLGGIVFGVSAQNLADYQGTYQLENNPYVKQVKFAVKDGKLVINAEGFPETELSPSKTADEFVLGNGDGAVVFGRTDGKVANIKIRAQGQELSGLLVSELGKYAGSYKMSENEYVKTLNIALTDGKLFMTSDSDDSQKSLLASTKDAHIFTTNVRGYDAEITFASEGDSVKGIKLSVAGGAVVLNGTK